MTAQGVTGWDSYALFISGFGFFYFTEKTQLLFWLWKSFGELGLGLMGIEKPYGFLSAYRDFVFKNCYWEMGKC